MADIATRAAFRCHGCRCGSSASSRSSSLAPAAALASSSARQRRLPAPFGPARNGLIPYASDGDIYVGDPVTGQTHLLVEGPETRSGAVTFARRHPDRVHAHVPGTTADRHVRRAATTDPTSTRITRAPIDNLHWGGWTPDDSRLALIHDVDGPVAGCATTICHIATLDLFDAAGSGAAETIATAERHELRPVPPARWSRDPLSGPRRREMGPVRDGRRRHGRADGRRADGAVRDGS